MPPAWSLTERTLALAEELGFLLNLPLVRASLTVTDCLVQEEVCVPKRGIYICLESSVEGETESNESDKESDRKSDKKHEKA